MMWHLGFPCHTSTLKILNLNLTLKILMIVELFLHFLMKCITHNITTAALWMTCTLWHNLDFTWKSNKFLLARFRFQFSATDLSWSWWNKDVGSLIFVSAYLCTPKKWNMSLLALKSKEAEPLLCLPFHKYFNHKKTRFVFSSFFSKKLCCV